LYVFQRVATFSHEVVPHYLRTKPDPEVESKHTSYEAKASAITPENLNKMQAVRCKKNDFGMAFTFLFYFMVYI